MNKRKGLLAVLLVMLVTVAGISAYFTDSETVTNTFTVGKIDIELQEPTWDALPDADGDDIPDAAENLLPNETVAKDPQVKNVGTNDAFVFLEVTVPYIANAKIFNESTGSVETEWSYLFDFEVEDEWSLVTDRNNNDGTKTLIYSYGLLLAGDTTAPLFEAVTMPNFVEGQGIEGTTNSITISALAIQFEGLTDLDEMSVFRTIKAQSGDYSWAEQ